MGAGQGIEAYCSISDGKFLLNGDVTYEAQNDDFGQLMRGAFKALCEPYPKFFKMDDLSKLAFITAELIFSSAKANDLFTPNTAMVFADRASSLDTDRKHQQSIESSNGEFTSPAVFVYTLPNICLGEISIRHQLFTEGNFFIFEEHDPISLARYADTMLGTNQAEQVLCAWVEKDGPQYGSFAFLLGASENKDARDQELLKIHEDT